LVLAGEELNEVERESEFAGRFSESPVKVIVRARPTSGATGCGVEIDEGAVRGAVARLRKNARLRAAAEASKTGKVLGFMKARTGEPLLCTFVRCDSTHSGKFPEPFLTKKAPPVRAGLLNLNVS
jgi:hypothetical protein